MNKTDQDLKDLVVARLELLSDDVEISIGDLGSFDKKEMIMNVEKDSLIGKKIIDIELQFMKDLVNGNMAKYLYSNLIHQVVIGNGEVCLE